MPDWASSCLPAIEEYDLSRNHLSGAIPADVGNMSRMNQFKFQGKGSASSAEHHPPTNACAGGRRSWPLVGCFNVGRVFSCA